jgi:Methyltransferase domain
MTASRRLTQLVTNEQRASVARQMRQRRWSMLHERFPELAEMRVIDIGGLAGSWLQAPARPSELVVLNLPGGDWTTRTTKLEDQLGPHATVRHVEGDACDLPAELRDERFDLVYCNSVIEHVGGHGRRIALADSVHSLGDHHWVQTPYRYFPVEPHSLIPGLQFLPSRWQAAAVRYWPFGHMSTFPSGDLLETEVAKRSHDRAGHNSKLRDIDPYYAVVTAQSVELLSKAELHTYFPTSEIVNERVLGLVKSLVAVR